MRYARDSMCMYGFELMEAAFVAEGGTETLQKGNLNRYKVGDDTDRDFKFVDRIPPEKSGKYMSVVSRL